MFESLYKYSTNVRTNRNESLCCDVSHQNEQRAQQQLSSANDNVVVEEYCCWPDNNNHNNVGQFAASFRHYNYTMQSIQQFEQGTRKRRRGRRRRIDCISCISSGGIECTKQNELQRELSLSSSLSAMEEDGPISSKLSIWARQMPAKASLVRMANNKTNYATASIQFIICLHLLVFHLLTASSFCLSILDKADIAKYPIHKQMTKQDLLSVFYVDSHDKVPEYELSSVRLLTKRSFDDNYGVDDDVETTKHVHLKAFGKKMRLKLKDNNDFNERVKDMKVILAETSRNGKLQYVEDLSVADTKNIGTSYHDKDNMAAIFLDHNSKGKVQLHGTIGHDLVIKPIPETIDARDHPHLNEIDDVDEPNDDDEMFLSEDDFSQLKQQQQQQRMARAEKEKNHSEEIMMVKNAKNNLFNKTITIPKTILTSNENIHVIYKRQIHDNHPQPSDFAELEHGFLDADSSKIHSTQWLGNMNNVTSNARTKRSIRVKRQAPGTVWPEVLLVVDYDSFMLHGATSRDVKRYFISFWNGVDLRYKLLAHPQIRVSLAGMIVAKDRDATPYLERNRLRPPNSDAVDAAGALTDMGKYLYREDRLPTYDMAVVITKLDMCRRRYEGGRCNRGTAGFAYVGGACVVNKRLEKVNSVAIIEDSGGYSGIIVAAHEVGHLLGCVHDGSPPPSYLGGPGATRCPWEDGFIMSDLRHTERGFRWSTCSVEQFKHFLNGETATCLYNFPHENQLLPRVLPGSMLSLDEQCKRDRGTNACFKDGRVCAQLFCFDSASGYCVSYRPAAEGSACGDGQICRNGKCLAELENIIPDYSHVAQAISRGPKSDRLLSRIDNSPIPHLPPFRRSLRFPRRDSFFHHHHHNFLRGAASDQTEVKTEEYQMPNTNI